MNDIYEQLTNVYYQLIDNAHDARAASYSPYSGIAVGAALLASSGKIYLGANIENASYSPTVCAERVAFFKAISAGERDFVAIAVVGAPANEEPSASFPPCGVCRQVMSEFCGPDFMIVLGTRDDIQLIPFAELLPHSFTKSNLEPAIPAGPSAEPKAPISDVDDADEASEEVDVEEYDDDESIEIYDLDDGNSEDEGKIWEI